MPVQGTHQVLASGHVLGTSVEGWGVGMGTHLSDHEGHSTCGSGDQHEHNHEVVGVGRCRVIPIIGQSLKLRGMTGTDQDMKERKKEKNLLVQTQRQLKSECLEQAEQHRTLKFC